MTSQIDKLIAKWKPILGLKEFHIGWGWYRINPNNYAETNDDQRHKIAFIRINRNKATKSNIEDTIIHELTHVLLGPFLHIISERGTTKLYDICHTIDEYCTLRITKALMKVENRRK